MVIHKFLEKETERRVSWNEYFYKIAKMVATRSTCLKRQIGSVIVSYDNIILATGYNGPARGAPHCESCNREGVPTGEKYDNCPAIHAELNAIIHAAKHGVKIHGAKLVVTSCPCYSCAKAIVNAGITDVIIPFENILPKVVNYLEDNDVTVHIILGD